MRNIIILNIYIRILIYASGLDEDSDFLKIFNNLHLSTSLYPGLLLILLIATYNDNLHERKHINITDNTIANILLFIMNNNVNKLTLKL